MFSNPASRGSLWQRLLPARPGRAHRGALIPVLVTARRSRCPRSTSEATSAASMRRTPALQASQRPLLAIAFVTDGHTARST